jgi:hypothetical protein
MKPCGIQIFSLLLLLNIAYLASAQVLNAQPISKPSSPSSAQAGSGPTFTVPESVLNKQVSVIVYGDMRFTDPSDTHAADPAARRLLVAKIAAEQPDAVQLTGDVPYSGGHESDYDVYRAETEPWRTAKLRIYPALGNHEFARGSKEECIEHWWTAFPELRGKRWYSVALGKRIYLVNLDSMSDLTDGSPQRAWLQEQIEHLPKTVDFVMIALHHPPVADIQTRFEVDHNPRGNEIPLRNYLSSIAPQTHASIVVTGGHIHNYERFLVDGVVYLVSGGGGAHPYEVDRTPPDLYQNNDFPNFHYIQFILDKDELRATMFRLVDPQATKPEWQARDTFTVKKK